ncbi:UbiE/COQ5 family methyltransferase (macronuclear) [Tetrahymena thermophila SB210]|uniref:UbiE/COQ5 family methyltransferase n=1 Tax=Tetrahymena thermophila (strain SB210) TaxID=312017 RepID=Q23A13_TETTS|nr:UbiE/COQ5 family methyltransferase [Tetrahymena thermophila SB210]EAR93350.1 UbiE/COQ5 family methyltransferase [Tetrahymena thermophila SB210]|eukprot:XP_001013595.1 UbiE/COQ5 family methyltransferase [Tetrahymena thermophila SB210]
MQEQTESENLFQGEQLVQLNEVNNASKENQQGILQSEQPSYKQKEYWNERYKFKQTYYDWYCGYEELKPVFEKCYNISKDAKILMIGCGNSKLSEDMFDDGYINIVSTDISDVVIQQMKEQTQKKNMIFEVQDCTNLTYQDQTFDFVFDKGTLDALSCDKEEQSVNKMLSEMMRVCKPQGSVIIVSFGQLHERKVVFQESLGFQKYSYELCQKYLSIDSQLTNIMRHVSNGLPINLVLKNKNLLLQTLIELRSIKGLLKNEVIQSLAIDWEQVTQKENAQEFQIQDEQKLEQGNDCFQNTQNENTAQIQQNTNEKNDINNSDQNDQLSNSSNKINQENNLQQNLIKKEEQSEKVNKKQEVIDQKQEQPQENEQVDNIPQQQSQHIEEEQNKNDCSLSDQEEESDSEEDKQKKPKFRRQTQCFIYRITHKN